MKNVLSVFIAVLCVTFAVAREGRSQWVDVEDANSGISCFASVNGKIFAGTGYGMLVSNDNGSTWADCSNGLTDSTVWALLVSGSNIFAGTEGGIFISTNSGVSWSPRNNGLTEGTFVNDAVYALAQVGSTLFAGTSPNGVYASQDNGSSWSTANSGIDVPEINALTTIGNNVFAGTMEDGVYRSADLGSDWELVDNGMTATQVDDLVAVGGMLYAGTPSNGAFLSTDMGDSWSSINNGFASISYVNGFGSSGTDVFALKNDGIYLSTNNGANWTAENDGLSDLRIRAITMSGANVLAGAWIATIWERSLASMTASGVQTAAATATLAQCYPNPFTHATTISFTSSESGFASVSIVNQLGEVVANVFSGQVDAGDHSWQWVAPQSLTDGVYECIVRINGQNECSLLTIKQQ